MYCIREKWCKQQSSLEGHFGRTKSKWCILKFKKSACLFTCDIWIGIYQIQGFWFWGIGFDIVLVSKYWFWSSFDFYKLFYSFYFEKNFWYITMYRWKTYISSKSDAHNGRSIVWTTARILILKVRAEQQISNKLREKFA